MYVCVVEIFKLELDMIRNIVLFNVIGYFVFSVNVGFSEGLFVLFCGMMIVGRMFDDFMVL